MKISFELKPYTVKETHFDNLNDAIYYTMANYGAVAYGTYGNGVRRPIGRYESNASYAYSVETFKRGRGKYRTKPKQIFRIFKFTDEFLKAGNLEVVQHHRYFRLRSKITNKARYCL